MINIDPALTSGSLKPRLERFFSLSAGKIRNLAQSWNPADGSPVLTVRGAYTTRTWADWTQGFQFGSALLEFEATNDPWFLNWARQSILRWMPKHVTNVGSHDHGFDIVSSYGNLLRLIVDGRASGDVRGQCGLALRVSGAVQAARWTPLPGGGYIHSFHGRHSLFVDSIRSLRSLAIAHLLGQELIGEGDAHIGLLDRLVQHASTTAKYCVFYGEARDYYDVRGRVAHECLFNVTNGAYRSVSTQQGFSPFSTWTRALSWAMLGFAEELEFLASIPDEELAPSGGRAPIEAAMRRAAEAACDYYIEQAAADGIPYWDTAAPGLAFLPGYRDCPSDPFNQYEPVDSSAAAVAAQGLWRLGAYLNKSHATAPLAEKYRSAALTIAGSLFTEPYLSEDPAHQGLILHAIYNRPGAWDYVPQGRSIPCGESVMWGDYHALELALLIQRDLRHEPYWTFFSVHPQNAETGNPSKI